MLFSEKDSELLKQAFENYNDSVMEALPTDEELESINFSPRFEKKMQRLINRQKKPYYSMINTAAKRVACIAIIVLVGLTATTLSVEAIREPFINFVIETYEKFTSIIFQKDLPPEKLFFTEAIPKYIPDGFVLETQEDDEFGLMMVYKNAENEYIIYSIETADAMTIQLDTENTNCNKIEINNSDGIIYENKGEVTVVFADEQNVFTVSGDISRSDAMKIAKSIKI